MIQSALIDKLDVRPVWPFIAATIETLKVQFNVASNIGKPYFKSQQKECKKDFVAVVGMSTHTFSGTTAICFSKQAVMNIVGATFGNNFSAAPKDLTSAVGELMNIIFSKAMQQLHAKGLNNVHRGVPVIVTGEDVTFCYLTTGETAVIPIESSVGDIHIEITNDLVNGAK